MEFRRPRPSYQDASQEEILAYARTLKSVRVGALQEEAATYTYANKGEVGDRIERAFGLPRGGHGADFPRAGIELKSTELIHRASGWSVRWRTSVGMINRRTLIDETWDTATIRNKLAKILFIFYRREPGQSAEDYAIDREYLWEPNHADWDLIRNDWEAIQRRVVEGQPLSESLSRVLGAATKGPRNSTSRAFSLKRPFVGGIYAAACGAAAVPLANVQRGRDLEGLILDYLRRWQGRTIRDVARHIRLKETSAKHYSALAIWGLLGARTTGQRLKELDDVGITRRIIPLRADGEVLDPTSMMGFRIDELSEESWGDSLLRERMQKVLFVPLLGARRNGPQRERIIGRAFIYEPTPADWRGLKEEWTTFRDFAKRGKLLDALPPSEMRYIHVRTKGRDSRDIDPSTRSPIPKRGFYLAGAFVRRIYEAS